MGIENIARVEEALQKDFPDLFFRLERQRGITGFVSILGTDNRVKVFSRYNHIMRVVKLTRWLLTLFPERDCHKSLFLAYFHDINRLPFAHNFEKKIKFDQAANIPFYLRSSSDVIPNEYISDLQSVINQQINSSPEAQLVYAADAAEGFIEDPLFAITTLGISKSILPQKVFSALGFDDKTSVFEDKIKKLNKLYTLNQEEFNALFENEVFKYTTKFILKLNSSDKIFIELPDFFELRQLLKEEFLRKIVFPINNEQVSQGYKIATEVAIPYMKYLKNKSIDPISILLKMTDQEVLDQAIKLGIASGSMEEYCPNLV